MPDPAAKAEVKTGFYELVHLPGVLGLVDWTHISIQKQSENEAYYVKTFLSVNYSPRFMPTEREV